MNIMNPQTTKHVNNKKPSNTTDLPRLFSLLKYDFEFQSEADVLQANGNQIGSLEETTVCGSARFQIAPLTQHNDGKGYEDAKLQKMTVLK